MARFIGMTIEVAAMRFVFAFALKSPSGFDLRPVRGVMLMSRVPCSRLGEHADPPTQSTPNALIGGREDMPTKT
jgi:hypothetical protein